MTEMNLKKAERYLEEFDILVISKNLELCYIYSWQFERFVPVVWNDVEENSGNNL